MRACGRESLAPGLNWPSIFLGFPSKRSVDLRFLFENYCLDAERRELTCGTELVAIGPKVFDLLLFLVRNRDQVVSRDDLLAAVWDGRIVSESTLTSHVNAVRKAIGDTGKEQRLIRTVSRKGMRFVGEVREDAPPARAAAAPSAIAIEAPAPILSLPDSPSIAVLPFRNLSGDAGQDYFADGVVEDIITALSRIRWLFVIARNSSFTYKGRTVDEKQVGRELGVRYVVEGSVRHAAGRVRITGQLVDAATGIHLWAERFEGTLDDIFELQDQIAISIVGAIAPSSSVPRSSAPGENRPAISAPTITICAPCRICTVAREKRSTTRCRCFTRPSHSIPSSPRPMPWRPGAIAGARSTDG